MDSNELKRKLAVLRNDYAEQTGKPFEHFFCPLLCRDEMAELCLGHVINKHINASCRTTVVQRKDIDGFYGRVFEPDFQTFLRADKLGSVALLADKDKSVRPQILLDGQRCEYYIAGGAAPAGHTRVQVVADEEDSLDVILKKSLEDIELATERTIILESDYRLPALVSLIKAAYLTMFRLMGYRYALSSAGLEVGYSILGRFFRENDGDTARARATAPTFFRPFANMVRPVEGVQGMPMPRGTLEDGNFGACFGSSGNAWGFIVYVRTGDQLHGVLMPAFTNADSVEVYHSFLTSDSEILRVTTTHYEPRDSSFSGGDPAKAASTFWPKRHGDLDFSDED